MQSTERVYIDCREYPTANNCGLMISGTEKEVLETAVHHAITRHGHKESPELREQLRKLLKKDTQRKAG
jgi:predicted small metal-binding protein